MFVMNNQLTYFLKTCTDNYNNGYNIIQIVAAIPSVIHSVTICRHSSTKFCNSQDGFSSQQMLECIPFVS